MIKLSSKRVVKINLLLEMDEWNNKHNFQSANENHIFQYILLAKKNIRKY